MLLFTLVRCAPSLVGRLGGPRRHLGVEGAFGKLHRYGIPDTKVGSIRDDPTLRSAPYDRVAPAKDSLR
jgi:hypothetical protein